MDGRRTYKSNSRAECHRWISRRLGHCRGSILSGLCRPTTPEAKLVWNSGSITRGEMLRMCEASKEHSGRVGLRVSLKPLRLRAKAIIVLASLTLTMTPILASGQDWIKTGTGLGVDK